MKSNFTNPLNDIKIASPCSQDWDEMVGTNRRRFCGECRLNVYNLSGMTRAEAENLILNAEGRLCVRFYRRADGTVLTKDCPVGWQAIKRRVSKTATAFASLVFAALSGIGLANYFAKTSEAQVVGAMPPVVAPPTTGEIYTENPPADVPEYPMMGAVAVIKEPVETVGRVSNFGKTKKRVLGRQN